MTSEPMTLPSWRTSLTHAGSRPARRQSTPQKGIVQTNHTKGTAARTARVRPSLDLHGPGPRIAGTMTMSQWR